MPLTATSQAAAVGASVDNQQFASSAEVLTRKMLIIGTYDPAITTITDDVAALVLSPEEVGATYGWGFMLHRLAVRASSGSNKSQMWVIPQAEAGGAVASTGTITFAGTSTAAGTIYWYIAGIAGQTPIPSGALPAATALAVVNDINAVKELPVTVAVNGVTPEQIDVTAKSKGPWGDDISLTFNWGFQEDYPATVSVAVVAMSGGSGVPTIADALDGLGTGLDANERHFTDMVHGYLQDSTSLDAVSVYNGVGNDAVGLYSKTIARPFRSLVGDVVAGSGGLSALVSLADGRKTDRSTGVIAAPGSPNHPAEIAACAMGVMQLLNSNRAEETAIGKILPGILPGATADRWTSDYSNLDTAVQGGIGTTKVSGGALLMQNMLTFYRPDSIPSSSNGYKSQRNISIIQNMLDAIKTNFESSRWQGISLVADVKNVSNITDRQKARDVEAVKDDLIALANSFLSKAWVYDVDGYTIPNISVQVRAGTNGFDAIIPVILSGEVGIIDTVIEFDTAITVLL